MNTCKLMPRSGVYVSGLVMTLSAMVSLTAHAADTTVEDGSLEEVVVTGSRLNVAGFNAPTPVTVVDFQTIEQRTPANIADVINEQPAFRATSSDTTRGGNPIQGAGQFTLNLRALGATRTLTLINGHRVAPTLWTDTVDTAIVPVGLVERIETVTGGASAAYGSDAIAGVSNIILRNKMQGVRASVQMGDTAYQSAKQYTATLAGGTALLDGRLNLIGGIDYNDSKLIGNAYGKDWGRNEIANITPSAAQRTVNPANLLPQTFISNNVEPGNAAPGGLIQTSPTVGVTPGVAYTFDANGNPVLFNQGTLWGNNQSMTGSTANYGYAAASLQPLRTPNYRVDVYGRASYDITPKVQAYVEVNKSRNLILPYKFNEFTSQGAANGVAGTPQLTISRTNPFVTPSTLALIGSASTFTLGRIDTEFGQSGIFGQGGQWYRQATDTHRIIAGLQGKFGKGWSWDAYYQTGKTTLTTRRMEYSPNAFQRAVDNCASFVGLNAAQQVALTQYEQMTGKTCVPFNPFGVGRNPVSAQDYFMVPIYAIMDISQNVVAASISGAPLTLPAGPLAVAFGAEYRMEEVASVQDPLSTANLLSQNLQPLSPTTPSRDNHVREVFTEFGIPVLKDKPFARSLDLNAAVRLTDYQLSGRVTTWKGGLTWEPLNFLKVRYTRSRDIRAPNLNELYFQGGLGAPTNVINRIPNGVVGANGTINVNPLGVNNTASVTTAAYGPSGGGTTLQPEIADTQTGGFVIQSGGFSSSLDYYHIQIKGLITNPGFQQVLDSCRDGDTRFCNEITFDSTAVNGISLLRPLTANLDTVTVEGYDAEVGYRAAALGGHFQVRALVNYQPHNRNYGVFTHLTTDNANVLGNQPKVGYNLSVGFDKGPLTLDVQIRGFTARTGNAVIYNPDGSINSSTVLGPEDAGYLVTNANTINKNRWPAQFTVNPSASFKLDEHISVFANVDNLFDVGPPPLSTNNTYDLIGRRYRVGVRAEF